MAHLCSPLFYARSLIVGAIISMFFIGIYRITKIQDHYQQFNEATAKKTFDLIGTVTEITQIDHPQYTCRITYELQKMRLTSPSALWQPVREIIYIYTTDCAAQVQDTIAIKEITFKKTTQESFKNYLHKEHVAATIFLPEVVSLLVHRPYISISRWLFDQRKALCANLSKKMNSPTSQLFSSIFLGQKPVHKKKFEPLKDHFATWGVLHYLARSGLHMVIFVCIWQWLFSCIPIYFAIKQLMLLALCLLYYLFSWSTISFHRALLTVLCYKISLLARIQISFLHLLTIICCAILLYNPLHLFFLDFQLSFGLTFALGLFAHLKQLHQKY